MIAKSASRFSEKITLEQKVGTGFEPDGFERGHLPAPGNGTKNLK
jgi:hypothetical protein